MKTVQIEQIDEIEEIDLEEEDINCLWGTMMECNHMSSFNTRATDYDIELKRFGETFCTNCLLGGLYDHLCPDNEPDEEEEEERRDREEYLKFEHLNRPLYKELLLDVEFEMAAFVNTIVGYEKVPSGDGFNYNFIIKSEVITVPGCDMLNSRRFETEYFQKFDEFVPVYLDWEHFIMLIQEYVLTLKKSTSK